MAFNREQLEHAHESVRRLRSRLRTLAQLCVARCERGCDYADVLARQVVDALDARACVVQSSSEINSPQRLGICVRDGVNAERLERLAARFVPEVVSAAGRAVTIDNLSARFINEPGIACYMGVPVFDASGRVMGAVAVMDEANRFFSEEDEWWLQAIARLVADWHACEQLNAKLRDLQNAQAQTDASKQADTFGCDDRKLSILLIDDDRVVNGLIAEFLTDEGYRVESAFDGLEAVRMFRPSEHDVVMTDVAMPNMNGWELSAALRVRAPHLPVVLITGYGSGNWNESYLRKQGVVTVLSKPLDLELLRDVLANISQRVKQAALC